MRRRELPAQVVVYYVIALALYMQSSYREVLRCLLEGLQWLSEPGTKMQVAGNSAISQARSRLGATVLRQLHDELVQPIASAATRGAWYRRRRLVSIDGSTLDIADQKRNEAAYGRPGASRGSSAYPQLRFVSLVEAGTHVLFGTRMGPYEVSEIALAKEVVPHLRKRDAVPGRPQFLQLPVVEQGAGLGRRSAVANQKESTFFPCAETAAGRFLPQPHLSVAAGPATRQQRGGRAGD